MSAPHLRVGRPLAAALSSHELDALVFEARRTGNEWTEIREELAAAYSASRSAAQAGRPVVYVIETDDLLGRRGRGNAMVATGLLSAARTLALELSRAGVPVNVVATTADVSIETLASWIAVLATGGADGPTGELVHLGGTQIGKALQ